MRHCANGIIWWLTLVLAHPSITAMLGESLLRYNKEVIYVPNDMETEGLNLYHSRLWQCSWARCTIEGIIEIKNRYIWWDDLSVSEDAAFVTRFNYDDYKSRARPAREVLDEYEADLFNTVYRPIGHNVLGYDTMIHQVWRRGCGLKPDYSYLPRCIDTLALARAYRKGIKPNISSPEAFLAWQYQMMSIRDKKMKCSQGALNKEFNLGYDESGLHDAFRDISLNMDVFKQLIWKVEV